MKSTAERLTAAYARQRYEQLQRPVKGVDQSLARTLLSTFSHLGRYTDPANLDTALDAIDLGRIYEEADKSDGLGYDDRLVKQTLAYFKEFFSWVDRPDCECGGKTQPTGSRPPPKNEDDVSVVETYRCLDCGKNVDFFRINNPVSLLRTRRGRCGEWVNCFMLVLQAVLGADAQLRYILNVEDHVWVEYYSTHLRRWVHLDPCEKAFDEPRLYCDNWGKKMSLVFGISSAGFVDLSDKYISPEKKIPAPDPRPTLHYLNGAVSRLFMESLALPTEARYQAFYRQMLVPQNRGGDYIHATKTATKGRQSGLAAWVSARGESG